MVNFSQCFFIAQGKNILGGDTMQNDLWLNFTSTGKVEDYLKFKQSEELKSNENEWQGNCNKGANSGGE